MKQIIFIIFYFFFFQNTQAQKIVGLWEVEKVSMDKQSMTPVAKWFRINADQTYQAGNGWLQNSEGTWIFDKKTKEYLASESNGIKDEFGAFQVSFSAQKMIWKRVEEGVEVSVILKKIEKLPQSTADQMQGLWDLDSASKNGKDFMSEIDPKQKRYIQIGWDRVFRMRYTPKGRLTGYWHINGHRPELILMYHDSSIEIESFMVSFENGKMIWTGKSDKQKGEILIFNRLSEFPK